MKPRLNIQRLHELLGIVLNGLDGQPFSWGDGQRQAWVPILKAAGVTLITKTQIEKHGYRLKRGAKPVGSAYFGAPIKRYADLYVLEVQCVKPKPPETDCWLFLDCEQMTGKPPEKCPNRKQCKQNALHTSNRSCNLPYQRWLPTPDQLFSIPTLQVLNSASEEARAAGWHPTFDLFYEYRHGGMWVGRFFNGGSPRIPEEAQALGFATAEDTPYWLNSKPGYLFVTITASGGERYPAKFKDAGWYPAIALPYYIMPDWNLGSVSVLKVSFPIDDPDYQDAIAAGWYPASELPIHPV